MWLTDSFLDYLRYERNYSDETVKAYGEDIRQFQSFGEEESGVQSPSEVEAELVREWVISLMDRGYTSTSINRKLSSLRSYYKFLLKKGEVKADPLRKVVGPKNKKPLPVFLRESDMNRLLDDIDFGDGFEGCRDYLIIEMFYATGMRLSELIGLDDKDVDFAASVIKVTGKDDNGAEVVKSYSIPFTQHSRVMPGDRVEKGDIITREGVLYPQDILAIKGLEDVQNYLINEVQKVYRLQGVEINDKHIEVIVRQMCRKVRVTDSGSSNLIGGALASRLEVESINADLQQRIDAGEEGLKLVEYQQVLLGITKAALANDSFLSAASFQETTRVLTEAAIKGKVDPLAGLKENVIIGKLIPAGTGLPEVREDLKNREAERDAEVAAELAAAVQ